MNLETPKLSLCNWNLRRFRIWHLLVLLTLVSAFTAFSVALADSSRNTQVTIEITKCQPSGSVDYVVNLPRGFSVSSVSIPLDDTYFDCPALVGTIYSMRYRSEQCLWLPPEDPFEIARQLVVKNLAKFALED